jgi:rfaE bifunctional protein kinase chain/domain
METQRIKSLLSAFSGCKVAVLGDFFLDLYIQLDRALSEFSLETHKEAFQAVDWRGQPGAAGVVTNNLNALGASSAAIGYTGQDGNGYTLRQALAGRNVDLSFFIESADRFTPTYTKPMMREVDGANLELNRIDLINRTPNPEALNEALAGSVHQALEDYDGLLVVEQVRLDGYGTLSPTVRRALAKAAAAHPDKPIIVDSRHFAAIYSDVGLKLNLAEAVRAVENMTVHDINLVAANAPLKTAKDCAERLWEKNRRPVFITLGDDGILGLAEGEAFHHPGVLVEGPIDIVGAGDSVLAGIGLALCAGASPEEAAYIGNLVGSITIQQLGTTGIATQTDVLSRHYQYQEQLENKTT